MRCMQIGIMINSDNDLRRAFQAHMAADKGLNKNKWSLEAGLGANTLANYLSGATKSMTLEKIKALADVRGMTLADLFAGPDRPQADMHLPMQNLPDQLVEVREMPVTAGMGYGSDLTDFENLKSVTYVTADIINEIRRDPGDLMALEVRGQSMSPVLESGDRVLIDTSDKMIGSEGIFTAFDGETIVTKWVERVPSSTPPRLRFKSFNEMSSDYEMLAEECNIIGRVVWYARKL